MLCAEALVRLIELSILTQQLLPGIRDPCAQGRPATFSVLERCISTVHILESSLNMTVELAWRIMALRAWS